MQMIWIGYKGGCALCMTSFESPHTTRRYEKRGWKKDSKEGLERRTRKRTGRGTIGSVASNDNRYRYGAFPQIDTHCQKTNNIYRRPCCVASCNCQAEHVTDGMKRRNNTCWRWTKKTKRIKAAFYLTMHFSADLRTSRQSSCRSCMD